MVRGQCHLTCSVLFESFYKPNHMLFLQISVFSKNGNSSYLLSLHWHKCFFRGSFFLKEWLVPSKTPCVCLVNGGSRNWNTHVHWLWQTLWGSVFIFSLLWQEHWNLHVWVTAGIIGAQAEAPVLWLRQNECLQQQWLRAGCEQPHV